MRFKKYGETGKNVSTVGFGGMRFDMKRSKSENADLVRYAFSRGINYFDTAPDYCEGESERIFGEAFKEMSGKYWVSTKGMPVFHDTATKAREAVHRSLDAMGVDKIDFYHVWCLRKMEHYELAMKSGGQYEGLLQCKEEGLIDHIVCSSHQPGSEIRSILEDGKFEGVLMGINILNFPYRWDGVQAANGLGYGVVAMNPLAGGEIPRHERELAFLSTTADETPTEAALRFLICCPQVSVTLVGFTTREHIDTACRIAESAAAFSETELDAVRSHLSNSMNSACTGCGYCTGCPKDIPVAGYMQVYNEHQLFGCDDAQMRNQMKHHLNWGWLVGRKAGADQCVECGICEEKCTQHLPITERLKQLAEWEQP